MYTHVHTYTEGTRKQTYTQNHNIYRQHAVPWMFRQTCKAYLAFWQTSLLTKSHRAVTPRSAEENRCLRAVHNTDLSLLRGGGKNNKLGNSLFQTFAVFWMLYAFFWVISLINTPTFLKASSFFTPTCLWRWNRQSVPKRRHIKFRRRRITQKKAYNKLGNFHTTEHFSPFRFVSAVIVFPLS